MQALNQASAGQHRPGTEPASSACWTGSELWLQLKTSSKSGDLIKPVQYCMGCKTQHNQSLVEDHQKEEDNLGLVALVVLLNMLLSGI